MMRSDIAKTIAGLVVIAVIVVATFLYGNAQREAQQKRDQDLKRQQAAATEMTPTKTPVKNAANSSSSPSVSPKPTASPATSPTPSPTPAATGTTGMPQTGPELAPIIGLAAIAVTYALYRRSQKLVPAAFKSRGRF